MQSDAVGQKRAGPFQVSLSLSLSFARAMAKRNFPSAARSLSLSLSLPLHPEGLALLGEFGVSGTVSVETQVHMLRVWHKHQNRLVVAVLGSLVPNDQHLHLWYGGACGLRHSSLK